MKVSGEQARELLQKGALLLDVRSPDEYASGHLPDAVNLPLPELLANPAGVGDIGRPVVVYCHRGVRSLMAVEKLEAIGYAVYDLGAMAQY